MIFQLTYRSEAIDDISIAQIKAILETARAFNSENDITGCLIFNGGFFVQLLEGEKEIVKGLYENIEIDKRHTEVDLLSEEHAEKRAFKGWDMAYLAPSEEVTSTKINALMESLDELTNNEIKPSFTSKVFWYNVETLLAEKGFYKSQR